MPGIDVVISGIGQSAVGRKLDASGLELTVDAALEAIGDAGLTPADVDGLATFPGRRPDAIPFSPVGTMDLKDALGLKLDWFAGAMEGSAQIGAIINAYAAIKAGRLLQRGVTKQGVQSQPGSRKHRMGAGCGIADGTERDDCAGKEIQ
jgi:hypothetical protein